MKKIIAKRGRVKVGSFDKTKANRGLASEPNNNKTSTNALCGEREQKLNVLFSSKTSVKIKLNIAIGIKKID